MRVLCSYPGKYGDLLWALPTVRALSEAVGEPVDLVIAGQFGSIVPLLQRQSYLGGVVALDSWEVVNTAPMTPRTPRFLLGGADYDEIFHLGYREWPQTDLPRETWACFAVQAEAGLRDTAMEHFDLDRPWITPLYPIPSPVAYAVGFTDEHFELKYGLTDLLLRQLQGRMPLARYPVNLSNSPRWNAEAVQPPNTGIGWDWESAAAWLAISPAFVGCCSALHVLARAMGVPCVLMEPNPHRHNDIFYPYGKSGHGVELVLGNDGLPTFDARAVWETLCTVLAASSARSGAGSGDTPTSSSSIDRAAPASGSNAPNVATAPPDGLGQFLSERLES